MREVEDTHIEIDLSLEEFYNGVDKTVKHKRKVHCNQCDGFGSLNKNVNLEQCDECNGQGFNIIEEGHELIRSYCRLCYGSGEAIPKDERCQKCEGTKLIDNEVEIPLSVEPGTKNHQILIFEGLGDDIPGIPESSNLVVTLNQKDHDIFERKSGYDLHFKKKISLFEALCGFNFNIKHLDGRILNIKSEKGDIISPGDVRKVDNEGMKYMDNNDPLKGNLYIIFEIEFPSKGSLNDENIEALKKVLSDKCSSTHDDISNDKGVKVESITLSSENIVIESDDQEDDKDAYIYDDDDDDDDYDEYDNPYYPNFGETVHTTQQCVQN